MSVSRWSREGDGVLIRRVALQMGNTAPLSSAGPMDPPNRGSGTSWKRETAGDSPEARNRGLKDEITTKEAYFIQINNDSGSIINVETDTKLIIEP